MTPQEWARQTVGRTEIKSRVYGIQPVFARLFVYLGGTEMARGLWKCQYSSDTVGCECTESECIGDLCEAYRECGSCEKLDREECPEY